MTSDKLSALGILFDRNASDFMVAVLYTTPAQVIYVRKIDKNYLPFIKLFRDGFISFISHDHAMVQSVRPQEHVFDSLLTRLDVSPAPVCR